MTGRHNWSFRVEGGLWDQRRGLVGAYLLHDLLLLMLTEGQALGLLSPCICNIPTKAVLRGRASFALQELHSVRGEAPSMQVQVWLAEFPDPNRCSMFDVQLAATVGQVNTSLLSFNTGDAAKVFKENQAFRIMYDSITCCFMSTS